MVKPISMLDEFIMKMNIDLFETGYNGDMFHYTSVSGFDSILFSDKDSITLWASRYDCLNDMSEGDIVKRVFKDVCDEMNYNGEFNEGMYDLMSNVKMTKTALLMHSVDDMIKVTRPECERFICSFSKNNDSLAMWNYYSKGNKYEGYNLGFWSQEVLDSLNKKYNDIEIGFHIYPIIYDEKEQKEKIRSLLLQLQEVYEQGDDSSVRNIISNKLWDWSLTFKSEFFQHEEEVRIVVDVVKRTKNEVLEKRPLEIKYRNNAGYIIPYIEIKLDKFTLNYAAFGPLQCDDAQKETQKDILNELLYNNGYNSVVGCSEIPVRY